MKIIEKITVDGNYGIEHMEAIIDTDTHGRVLLVGGMIFDDGRESWGRGAAIQLKPTDTFEQLKNTELAGWITLYGAVISGNDKSRPVMDISAHYLAKYSGLI